MKIIKQDLKTHDYRDGEWYIYWRKNGLFHREDGPAEVWGDCIKFYYYLNDHYYKNKDEYWKKVHANY